MSADSQQSFWSPKGIAEPFVGVLHHVGGDVVQVPGAQEGQVVHHHVAQVAPEVRQCL